MPVAAIADTHSSRAHASALTLNPGVWPILLYSDSRIQIQGRFLQTQTAACADKSEEMGDLGEKPGGLV